MSLMIWRLGGTILLTLSIGIAYRAISILSCGLGWRVAYRKDQITKNGQPKIRAVTFCFVCGLALLD
jgi:hypothetical protein